MKNIIIRMHRLKNLRSQNVGRIIYWDIGKFQGKKKKPVDPGAEAYRNEGNGCHGEGSSVVKSDNTKFKFGCFNEGRGYAEGLCGRLFRLCPAHL